jgi:hypothetical protein
MLVGTQWPTIPTDKTGVGSPAPPILANTVIETFIQPVRGGCTLCHRGATVVGSSKPADYSYLLLRAQGATR